MSKRADQVPGTLIPDVPAERRSESEWLAEIERRAHAAITLRPEGHGLREIGVTARSEADARELVQATLSSREIRRIKPVADMNALDAEHVLPNIENYLRRGIWFPACPPPPE